MRIAIVGAGIMGSTLAYFLGKVGCSVTLFDKGPIPNPNNCSFAAAGLLSPYAELSASLASIIEIGHFGIKSWRDIIISCKEDVFFRDNGTLCLAHPDYPHYLNRLSDTIKLKHSSDFSAVKSQDIEPDINSIYQRGIYLPTEAQVCASTLLMVLIEELRQFSVTLRPYCNIAEVNNQQLIADQCLLSFDWVIDCRGLGARDYFPNLSGVRGELVVVFAPNVQLQHVIRVHHPRYPIYIVPRPGSRYIIGASCIDSEDMSPLSVQTALELLSTAFSIHSGFSEARIQESRVQLRPTLASHLPIMIIDNRNKLVRINGLYRHGFLFAPLFADSVTTFFLSGRLEQEILPFTTQIS